MPLNGSTCGSTPSDGELREAQASAAPQVLSLLPSDPVSQDGICTQASSSPVGMAPGQRPPVVAGGSVADLPGRGRVLLS